MISVVMGVYNGEKTVERAIRSVLDGTYRDIEFIAVNDGSTDGTAELLSKIAEEDSRVKVINSVFPLSKKPLIMYTGFI